MRKSFNFFTLFFIIFLVISSSLYGQGWWGSVGKQFPAQTEVFTVEFDLVPRVESIRRAHITLSNMEPAGWGDNACIIRCVSPDDGSTGYMDARDGGSYLSHEEFFYDEGESYHFVILVDVAGETYTVNVNTIGFEDQTELVTDVAFRSDQAGVGELQWLNVTIPYTDADNAIDDPGAEMKNIVLKDQGGNVIWEDAQGTNYVPGGDFAITIDAEKDDFFANLTGPDDGWVYLPSEATGTGTMPDDNEDCSAMVWFAWDDDYLYCFAEVTDELINVNHATAWQNDCIELKIDPDPYAETSTGVAAFRLTAWGEDDAEEPLGVDNLTGGGENDGPFDPVAGEDFARKEIEGDDRYGYNLEFRVPFEAIVRENKVVDNAVDGIIGMAINVHDNDEGTREAALRWAASMDDAVWANPQLHGTVTFLEGNKVKLEAINSAGGDAVNENPDMYIPPTTIVKENTFNAPVTFDLGQNYPNPFNPTTSIEYSIVKATPVTLKIYNLAGQEVKSVVNKIQASGKYTVTFDASDLTTGVYFYQLRAGSKVQTKKMTLVK